MSDEWVKLQRVIELCACCGHDKELHHFNEGPCYQCSTQCQEFHPDLPPAPPPPARSRADAEKAIAGLLMGHTPSTSQVNCCSCGLWFNTHEGPFDFQHAEHVASVIAGHMAEAWDEGYLRGQHPWILADQTDDPIPEGVSPPAWGRNRNPYRVEGNQP